jgi:hypothetical protein
MDVGQPEVMDSYRAVLLVVSRLVTRQLCPLDQFKLFTVKESMEQGALISVCDF